MYEPVNQGPIFLTDLENQLERVGSPPYNLSLLQGAAEPRDVSKASDFTSRVVGPETEVKVLPNGAGSSLRVLWVSP